MTRFRKDRYIPSLIGFGLVALFLLISSPGRGQPLPARLESTIRLGKEFIYDLRFEKADSLFITAQHEFSDYPHGFVYQTYLTSLIYALDQSNDSLDNALQDQIKKSLQVSENYRNAYPDLPGGYFYLGLTHSIKALYHIVNRSYIKGYWHGRKSKGNLQKVVALDSTFYDAYFGLGLFHYYADLLPGLIKFIASILGFDGNRVLGMQEIKSTADKGHFFKFEAFFMYHSIRYFLEGDKANAFQQLLKMHHRYPHNQGITLMIAYHYRRSGFPRKCIEYCRQMSDEFSGLLPQVTNMKYYNMALSYWDMNQFEEADSLFDILTNLPTRKSRYYQSAIAYYKGFLADLRFDRETALTEYKKIQNTRQTRYWYWLSRPLKKYPMDSLMYQYFIAENLLGNRKFRTSLQMTNALKKRLLEGEKSRNPDFKFLVWDLLGRNYYYTRQLEKARLAFETIVPRLKSMEDEFRRAWVYINYHRCLRDLGELEQARRMLEKANNIDEEYTKLIIEREKFILKNKIKKREALKTQVLR